MNNTIEIMFRKSFHSGLTGLDWLLNVLIGIFNWSKYSHVELYYKTEANEYSWSSTYKDGVRALCHKRSVGIWDTIVIEVTEDELSRLQLFFNNKNMKEYDWKAIFKHLNFKVKNDPNKYYCSELIAEALAFAGILNIKRTDLSVKGIYRIMANLHSIEKHSQAGA